MLSGLLRPSWILEPQSTCISLRDGSKTSLGARKQWATDHYNTSRYSLQCLPQSLRLGRNRAGIQDTCHRASSPDTALWRHRGRSQLSNAEEHGVPRMDFVQLGNVSTFASFEDWPPLTFISRLVGFSFMFTPLIKKPPNWTLPVPSQDRNWYGEIWLKYPLTDTLSPSYFGDIFHAKSQFRIIMNEFCCTAYSEGSQVTIDKAYDLRLKLKRWYNGLPGSLQPKTIVLPSHLQLQ